MKHLFLTLFLLLCPALLSAQKTYTANLVTPPAGMKTVDAMASIETIDFYGHTGQEMLNLTLGTAGGEVYIRGLVSDFPEAWIKGTANASKDAITFPHGQYVGLFFEMLDLYACAYKNNDTSKRCDFVLDRNTSSGVMKNRAGINFCTYYYDDFSTSANKYTPEQRYSSVTITPLGEWEPEESGAQVDPDEKKPVVVPAGVELREYTLTATSLRTGRITHAAKLGFDESASSGSEQTVYLGGFCSVAEQTGAFVKGYRIDNRIIFPQDQFIANYSGHDMWLYGTSYRLGDRDLYLDNLSFVYDAATDTYRSEIGFLVADGRAVDGNVMNFSELLQDITLIGKGADGIDAIQFAPGNATAPGTATAPGNATTPGTATDPANIYTLDGRRYSAPVSGVGIERRPDGSVRKVIR